MASAQSDRNLLFGILAVQMDFIGRDELVAAMHAWVLDKGKPLGLILQERGALSGPHRPGRAAGRGRRCPPGEGLGLGGRPPVPGRTTVGEPWAAGLARKNVATGPRSPCRSAPCRRTLPSPSPAACPPSRV